MQSTAAQVRSAVCNRDCFNCPFDDCVVDDYTYDEVVEARERDKEYALTEMDNSTREKVKKNTEYLREYYQKNKDKKSEYNRWYREEHKDEMREYYCKYRQEHKEAIQAYQREYQRKYRQEHKEELNAYQREYRRRRKEALESETKEGVRR